MQQLDYQKSFLLRHWSQFHDAPKAFKGEQARMFTALQYGLPIGLISHFGFLILFWTLDFPLLALFNVFSVVVFAVGTWRLYQGNQVWAVWTCVLFEVPVHAVIATLYLGFNAGFWLHIFIAIATIVLFPSLSRPVRFFVGFALVLAIGAGALSAISNGSVYLVSPGQSAVFLVMNLLVLALVIMVVISSYDLAVERAERAQQTEFDRAETLLLNILPTEVAVRLKAHEEPLADKHEHVSVLFADIAGFTNLSRHLSAESLVTLLNDLFTRFDLLAETSGAEKIKTIGDAYMAATGLRGESDHAETIVDMAIGMQQAFEEFEEKNDLKLSLRIGVHSGSLVAGVIGKQKFTYDLWGNTVNIASRMESEGVAGRIQISSETRNLLPERFITIPRGEIKIKGHRSRECFLLEH